eukprot:CAMPEP_0115263694 /NCGR_PEP_ID=MMETSP0270-20121206/50046_1 /TAXON_ID=71861 /ORGANISM="Scrippsiella trochoidea, Strain CCMP3099" /LENGTH=85 /DNA_ID=CAMNT_0002679691 /DNA_START=9 /DNA_END=263 /DNA_ORIENTATION=+
MELHYDSLSYFKGKIEANADKLDEFQQNVGRELDRLKASLYDNFGIKEPAVTPDSLSSPPSVCAPMATTTSSQVVKMVAAATSEA